MEGADGGHINDLSVEKFYTRIGRQHSRLPHSVVFIHFETMFRRRLHRANLTNSFHAGNQTFLLSKCAATLSLNAPARSAQLENRGAEARSGVAGRGVRTSRR